MNYKQYFKNIDIFSNKTELERKINMIINPYKKKQYICDRANNNFPLFDQLLENKIIVDDKTVFLDSYFDNLILKIKQETSIYYNIDIKEYKDNLFDEKILKENINKRKDQYSKDFIEKYSGNISEIITNRIKTDGHDFKIFNAPNEKITSKFKNHESILFDIYFKYIEKIYRKVIKNKLKNKILEGYLKGK